MSRPFLSHSIDQLTAEFQRARTAGDMVALQTLLNELNFRRTPRARILKEDVEASLGQPQRRHSAVPPGGCKGGNAGDNLTNARRDARNAQSPARGHTAIKPTQEQEEAIAHFLGGGSLKINAFAGTGKTSTLAMLAERTGRRGQYIAFNRAIVADGREKFPSTVNCSTTHGLAFKAMAAGYGGSSDKLTGKMNANQLAEVLGLGQWRIDKDHSLAPRSQGFLILETIRRFTQSGDKEPTTLHVPRHGSLRAASATTLATVDEFAVKGAKHVWERMQSRSDPIPLGHDGYLKLWALSEPVIAADFILLDEAQDTNPVVLDLLQKQPAQMIYVGDKHQQIYEWRGAVNAMEEIDTDRSCFLTTSFRFGSAIADAASRILSLLGEARALKGNPRSHSRIGPTDPLTILARTNASTITAVIEALDKGIRPHLVGGITELMAMLRGVQELKVGTPSVVPEFFGFANWQEVVEFARSGEGEHLQTFVNLVETRGERQLMWALNRTAEADRCDQIISTAHKAKGREWTTVRLMDDFLKSQPRQDATPDATGRIKGHDPAELRLFYVALTRAKEAIEVPSPLLPLIGVLEEAPVEARPMTCDAAPWSGEVRWAAPRGAAGQTTSQGRSSARGENGWVPPKNWRPPDAPPLSPMTAPLKPASEQGRRPRGFLHWLFGK